MGHRTLLLVLSGAALGAMASLAQDRPPGPPPDQVVFRALDSNQDGAFSPEEIDAAASTLKRLDADRDGTVSREEIQKAAGAPRRPSAASGPSGGTEPAVAGPPLAANDDERKILAVIEELDGFRQGTMNVPREDGRLLRILVESIGAKHVVELGTSNGYSGLWIALGLQKTGGTLTTFEIDEGRYNMATEAFKKAGVASSIRQILGDAHEEVTKVDGPVDLVFIDADKAGYLDYLEKLLPKVRPGGLILAHNMKSPPPDPQFVKAITTNPALETQFYNMNAAGISVTLKKR